MAESAGNLIGVTTAAVSRSLTACLLSDLPASELKVVVSAKHSEERHDTQIKGVLHNQDLTFATFRTLITLC